MLFETMQCEKDRNRSKTAYKVLLLFFSLVKSTMLISTFVIPI